MLIQYDKHVYQCETLTIYGESSSTEFIKGRRLFKNGRLGKQIKFFVPGGTYFTIIKED